MSRRWLHCTKCNEVVPFVKAYPRWDWHVDCKVFDRPGRPKGVSKTLDFASHRRAYHPLKAVKVIEEKLARLLLQTGKVTCPLTPVEWLALGGE